MSSFWQFLLLGLGVGASYVLCAQGIVVIHRGSGIVNFAQGAFGLIGAFSAQEARDLGLPVWLSLVAGVVVAAISGAAVHALVIRRLHQASQLSQVIATLGLLTVASSLFSLHYRDKVVFPSVVVGEAQLHIAGAHVSGYALFLLALALVISAGLWALYRFTLFGLRTTAGAENPRAAASLGHEPASAAGLNWTLGAALGGLGGAAIAPIIGLGVSVLGLVLLPSLAAALMGRFNAFGATCLGGLVVGVGGSELTNYNLGPGWSNAAPFIVVIVVLVIRGRALPTRGVRTSRLPMIGSGRVSWPWAILATVVVVVLLFKLSPDAVSALTTSLLTATLMLSVVVVTGYAGQISLAQLGLAGVGAFVAAKVAADLHWTFALAVLAATLLVVPVGAVVGLPALRTRGFTLAIVTLGFGVVVETVLFGNPNYVGGAIGIQLPTPAVFGLDLDPLLYPERYGLVCLIALVVMALMVTNLRRSQIGRRLIALRGNEQAAAAMGIRVASTKLYAFSVSAAISALAGSLMIFRSPSAVFTGFTSITSITLLTLVVTGGVGYVGGAWFAGLLGASGFVTYLFDRILTGPNVATWIGAVSGLAVVVTVLVAGDGVAAKMAGTYQRVRRWRSHSRTSDLGSGATATPTSGRAKHVLRLDRVGVRFGGVVALDNVSTTVASGEIVGLIGPNGAGKTSLVDAVSGVTKDYSGTIELDGAPMEGMGSASRARRGVTRSFQALDLFEDLSVLANLQVASERPTWRAYLRDLVLPTKTPLSAATVSAIHIFGLDEDLDKMPLELSFGRRRLVAIARAVAADPAVILLDEPAAGLDEKESARLGVLLRQLADTWGYALLVIEHDVNLVMAISDRVVALDFGRVIADGSPADVRLDPSVIRAYLGEPSTDHANAVAESA